MPITILKSPSLLKATRAMTSASAYHVPPTGISLNMNYFRCLEDFRFIEAACISHILRVRVDFISFEDAHYRAAFIMI